MHIITCTLPNAATVINGVAFTETEDGMVSGPVDKDTAGLFAGIPGYAVADAEPAKETKGSKTAKTPE